jgi:hypothetical protein
VTRIDTRANTPTPPAGSITLDQRLADMDAKLDQIVENQSVGSRRFALHGIRLLALETIVYGACGIAGGVAVFKAVAKVLTP